MFLSAVVAFLCRFLWPYSSLAQARPRRPLKTPTFHCIQADGHQWSVTPEWIQPAVHKFAIQQQEPHILSVCVVFTLCNTGAAAGRVRADRAGRLHPAGPREGHPQLAQGEHRPAGPGGRVGGVAVPGAGLPAGGRQRGQLQAHVRAPAGGLRAGGVPPVHLQAGGLLVVVGAAVHLQAGVLLLLLVVGGNTVLAYGESRQT